MAFVRGISPSAHDKFVKLPVKPLIAKVDPLVEAKQPEETESSLRDQIDDLRALVETMGPAAKYGGPARILRTVSQFYSVKISEIKGAARLRPIVVARHHACWRMSVDCCHLSTTAIGVMLGLDHSTVLYALRNWPHTAMRSGIDPYAWPPRRL